jgi:hypothetical protein
LALWVEKKAIVGISLPFFTLSPAFIDRMRNQLPLSGHWIIFASIFLILSDKEKLGCGYSWVELQPILNPIFFRS